MNLARDVTVTKLTYGSESSYSYAGQVAYTDEDTIVVRCPWPLPKTVDLGPFKIVPGDIFIEVYPRHEWFNIFCIYDAIGLLKGWYANVTLPVEISATEVRWRDLALDLMVLPNGEQTVLDEDEFAKLSLPDDMRKRAEEALQTLCRWAREGHAPFVCDAS